jgi:hypothetical protein
LEYNKSDRAAFLKAADEAIAARASVTLNSTELKRIRTSVARGSVPTAWQLTRVNWNRERFGLPRVSLPVFDRERRKKQWAIWEQTVNETQDKIAASRPLAPPRRSEI